jgi:hypothetical protein
MNKKLKKVWRLKVGGVKMKKNGRKKNVLQSYYSFLAGPLALHFKYDL